MRESIEKRIKYIKTIKGHKDVDNILSSNEHLSLEVAREEKLAPYRTVGESFVFGRYEQDNDTSNGPEDIEWIVLAADDDVCLIISKQGIDAKKYNDKKTSTTWEKCTLRSWLNNEFINTAFDENERKAIALTNVNNGYSSGSKNFSTQGGNNTQDYVFLLSIEENERYMTYRIAEKLQVTEYVSENSEPQELMLERQWAWWLRSPGRRQDKACVVANGGVGFNIDVDEECVIRPALMLSFDCLVE